MPSYLTEYSDGRVGTVMEYGHVYSISGRSSGPSIRGRTWQEAERVLDVLKELGMVHPEIKIIGKLEEEWDGQADLGS